MLNIVEHKVDLCIIGGGLAGMGAAIEAAKHGIKTLLMHERPVLGGNASSEIRMWVCGCWGYMETGLIEELRQENIFRNPNGNYSIWDLLLYEKVRFQENLTLLLNCSCMDATMDGSNIKSIKGWQLTTQEFHNVEAKFFADCSGDSILAPLTGAKFRWGRESKLEFNESMAPDKEDKCTMGLSCLMQARETNEPQKFTPPSWINHYPDDTPLKNRYHNLGPYQNFWFIELGGQGDTIKDTEILRDELLKTSLGVWDHIKNHGEHEAENWALDWIGFLPGKRESRRYEGDYIMTQEDILEGRTFPDCVAYGGWPLDDHYPAGFLHKGEPNTHVYPKQPYGIPLRALYSKNIDNLFFAGRNISASHMALSSTRVMATCMLLGQAVGSAAITCINKNVSPRTAAKEYIAEIQQRLMNDDCTLPGFSRKRSNLTLNAKLVVSNGQNSDILRTGQDRGEGNYWSAQANDFAEYEFDTPQDISQIRVIFDTNLERTGLEGRNLPAGYPLKITPKEISVKTISGFSIFADDKEIYQTSDQHLRYFCLPVKLKAKKIRLQINQTRGENGNIFAFDVN